MKKKTQFDLPANASLKELVTRDRKVVASLPFVMPDPEQARFIVRADSRTILLPKTKKRFNKLKDIYGNGIDKGSKFKAVYWKEGKKRTKKRNHAKEIV